MARWIPPPEYRPTPEMQAERDLNQRDPSHRFSPGARYWPTRTVVIDAPTLPDGSLDVRRWLTLLDSHFNEGLG